MPDATAAQAALREVWRARNRLRTRGTTDAPTFECKVCGVDVPQDSSSQGRRLYCSDECRREQDRRRRHPARRTFTCMSCGKDWTRTATRGQFPAYCSPTCRRDANRSRKAGLEMVSRSLIYERDGWICRLCGEPVSPDLRFPHRMSATLDHVVPLSLGGAHEPGNVQLAHLSCNAAKGNRRVA